MIKHFPILLLLSILVEGCDYIEYHPYDLDIAGEENIHAKNIPLIEERCEGRETIRFAMISDTQRHYDETEAAIASINSRDDIDFVINGGDVSDFGLKREFMWMRDIMNKLTVPYVCLLGNHDCQGTGEEVFKKVFGPENFAFVTGNIRFICLNTNAMEYDYSRPVPDFRFIDDQLRNTPEEATRTIFAMHVRPGEFQFNNNVAKFFEYCVQQFPDPIFCIFGHEHHWIAEDLFQDGLMYYGCPSIEKRNYLVFTVTPENYSYEMVDF